MTFDRATFVLATFVNSKNILAVTDPVLSNFNSRFLGPSIIDTVTFDQAICPGAFVHIRNMSVDTIQIF